MVLSLAACLAPTSSRAADKAPAPPAPPSPAAVTGAVMKPVVRRPGPPPAPVFKVRDFGAKGDGESDDTQALRKAIAACAGTGGSVLLEPGTYVSGNLELKGRMTLYLAEGAVLKASPRPADFPTVEPKVISGTSAWFACKRSLLFAEKADGLRIDGLGTIDGNAETLRDAGMKGRGNPRPSILRVFSSKDVAVRNVTLRNALMWTQVYEDCENLLVENLLVRNPPLMKTIDGMDVCNCRHVVIRNNDLESPDDVICFKSHGPKGIEDVLVENNTVRCHFANGIKFGTASVGPIRDVRFIDNTVLKATGGFCIESVDGSVIENIRVKGLTLRNCAQPIFIRLAYRGSFFEIDPAVYPKEPGAIDDVLIENVLVTDVPESVSPANTITGLMRKNLGRITLRDMRVEMPGGGDAKVKEPKENDAAYPNSAMFRTVPAYAFFVRHADAVTFERVETVPMAPDARPWLHAAKAEVVTKDCRESAPPKPPADAAGPDTQVFLLVGQSNMSGRGKISESSFVPDPRILCYGDGLFGTKPGIARATDTLRHDYGTVSLKKENAPSGNAVGPGCSFAAAVLPKLGPKDKILLVNRAWGGTTSAQWLPDAKYPQTKLPTGYPLKTNLYRTALADFHAAMAAVKAAGGTPRVGGILWLQGEGDAGIRKYDQYHDKVMAILGGLRDDIGAKHGLGKDAIPIVIAEIAQQYHDSKDFRAQQRRIAKDLGAGFSSSEGLATRDIPGDRNVHFTAAAQATVGQRMAEAWLALRKPAAAQKTAAPA